MLFGHEVLICSLWVLIAVTFVIVCDRLFGCVMLVNFMFFCGFGC